MWTLIHSAFLRVTGLLLMNYEIGQSIERTTDFFWTSFALAQFTYSCVTFFAILLESSKRLAVLRDIYMWIGYFTSGAVAILFIVCHRPSHPQPSSFSAIVHHPPSSFVTFVYCIQRAEDIIKHLPRPHRSTIWVIWPWSPVPNSKGLLQQWSNS